MTQSNPTDFCVVGFGIAGQVLVLELLTKGIHPQSILICDETFLGGDLVTTYSTVLSNTPWSKIRPCFEAYPQWSQEAIQLGDSKLQPSDCMPVGFLASLLHLTAKQATAHCKKIKTRVHTTNYDNELWTINHATGSLTAKTLFLAQGGIPKEHDLAAPTIPLETAFSKERLATFMRPPQKVVLFGTAHSGTLILQNLHDLGISTTAIYKGSTPFLFARDGHYGGVKEASEGIANAILAGQFPTVSLIPWSNPLQVHKALVDASYVIYAHGFHTRPLANATEYNPDTAALSIGPRAFGFGLAYPGVTVLDGHTYVDVSLPSFQQQIQRCLPGILS